MTPALPSHARRAWKVPELLSSNGTGSALSTSPRNAVRKLGNIPEARRLYQQCIEDFPDDPTAFNDFAWLILDTMRDPALYEQAEKYARSAVAMAKKAKARNALPGYLDTLALAHIRFKRPAEALPLLDEAMKLWADLKRPDQPKFLETLLNAAEEFHAQDKHVEALQALDRLFGIGYADEETAKRASELLPKVASALMTSAQLLGSDGRKEEARELMRAVINAKALDDSQKGRAQALLAQWNGEMSP